MHDVIVYLLDATDDCPSHHASGMNHREQFLDTWMTHGTWSTGPWAASHGATSVPSD